MILLRRRDGPYPTPQAPVLSAAAKASPIAATAAALPLLEAGLAVHRTVSARFERYSSLLSAPGTNHGSAACLTALVASAGLFLFLGLPALFAPFRR